MKRALLSIFALVVLAGCSQTPAPAVVSRETDVKSLRAAQEAAIEAFVSKNADHMVSAYSADASLMFPNSPILQGEGLRTAIRALAADPNFSMRFSTDKVEAARVETSPLHSSSNQTDVNRTTPSLVTGCGVRPALSSRPKKTATQTRIRRVVIDFLLSYADCFLRSILAR